MESHRLVELAATISTATNNIHDYLKDRNLPYPSFEPDAPMELPEELGDAENSVLDAICELYDLIINPVSAVLGGSPGNFMSLNIIHHFDIANTFAPGQEATFAQIAASTGLNETAVKHILRHAITLRVFREPRPGVITHTARSALMRDRKKTDFMVFCIEELTGPFFRAAEALKKWPGSDESNHTGFSLAHNTDHSLYEKLQGDPAFAARMANSMNVFATGKSFSAAAVVDGYDWGSLEENTVVVDVGGSRGHIAAAVASKFPLNFVVQDFENTVAGAEKELPPQVAGRVSFMVHDFFQEQPVVAPVYFFRYILHNWPDSYCIKILRALVPALRPGARIILNEAILGGEGKTPTWREKEVRTLSLGMISMFNAYERDIEDWKRLLPQVDSRLSRIQEYPYASMITTQSVLNVDTSF
ncbi:hypothetical protein BBP40_005838 [Aspergillus hancockii]|nr:hypothetical protein BBP40_005838 [Aspergillus hancockii]